ncbi:signal peptidase I [Psychrilyobacter sp.]|uniref:signal peptidase I n=1 Tax=Psychrilyobacter sp. TaxID=2586924 RepID=UPI0030165112
MKKLRKSIKYLIILTLVYLPFAFTVPNYLMVNTSSSMPEGIYYTSNFDHKNLKKGEVISLAIPLNARKVLYSREYLGSHTKKLIKTVAGKAGDLIEIKKNKVFINSEYVGRISKLDSKGRVLTSSLKSGIIPINKVFVLGMIENSYDSRYFGLISKDIILKKAELILKF